METNNSLLRREFKIKRDALTEAEVKEKSARVVANFLSFGEYNNYKKMLCFYPLENEVDLRELYQCLLEKGFRLFFPRTKDSQMTFYEIGDLSRDFEIGRFNIHEPKEYCKRLESFDDTLVITPGLVFDLNCNRIGFGGGFYDRFFSMNPDVLKVGMCFDFQITDALVPMEHDVALDVIISESQIIGRRK